MKEQTMNNLELKPSERQQMMMRKLGDPTVDREVVMDFIAELENMGYIKLRGKHKFNGKYVFSSKQQLLDIESVWDTYRWGQRFGERGK